MNAIRTETIVQTDGELHLTRLPCRKGDRVEAIVRVLEEVAKKKPITDLDADEKKREEARQRFLELARSSKFRSIAPYPTRDELHERS